MWRIVSYTCGVFLNDDIITHLCIFLYYANCVIDEIIRGQCSETIGEGCDCLGTGFSGTYCDVDGGDIGSPAPQHRMSWSVMVVISVLVSWAIVV
mmetsp:Transcript_4652/g.8752  ORF Transcript_4652/g.8752 Transcript_4652/m.8752 type:complete len:95 (-) Transcript_4652:141-425(-)